MQNPKTWTDEQLASALIEIGSGFWFNSQKAIMVEAATRLRVRTEEGFAKYRAEEAKKPLP